MVKYPELVKEDPVIVIQSGDSSLTPVQFDYKQYILSIIQGKEEKVIEESSAFKLGIITERYTAEKEKTDKLGKENIELKEKLKELEARVML